MRDRPEPDERRARPTPRWLAYAGLLALVALIWVLDWWTGHELRLFLLYFLPVSLAGWFLGRTAGLAVAAVCAVAWITADMLSGHEYGEPAHQVANAVVQLLTFAFVAVLLARTAKGLRTEQALNAGLVREKERVERLNEATARDLELAKKVQRAILPPESPDVPGLDVAVTYRPAIQIGGDVLVLHRVDAHRTVFFLGDVMGHGAHAALIMSAVSVEVRRIAADRPEPSALLSALNATLISSFPDQLLTAACCVVDAERRTATLAVAGHPPPLLARAAGGVEEVEVRGTVLGMLDDVRCRARDVLLEPGDLLLLYTDGVTETEGAGAERYGEERLRSVLEQAGDATARDVTARLVADLVAFRDGAPFDDDVALLVVRVPAA